MSFVALFTALLFLKVFHWLMQDRIAYMEQTPAVSLLTHGRMLLLMALLFALDAAFLYHAVSVSLTRGPSVLLLFAFEHLVLASTVCSIFAKYALHINDLRLEGRWDEKGVYLFYLDLATDLFHMIVYLAFFVLICTYYGLPLHIMRDLYLTCRSFRSRVSDFVRYRRVTHNMQVRRCPLTIPALPPRQPLPSRPPHDPALPLVCPSLLPRHCPSLPPRHAHRRKPSRTRPTRSWMPQIASASSAAST